MSVENVIKEIKTRCTQKSANIKDEKAVMRELINDHSFKTSVYNKEGEIVDYVCPADNMDNMVSNIISKTTGISYREAEGLAAGYEYNNADAENMIIIAKEYFNQYLETGRKINMGKRKDSDISLVQKIVPASSRKVPKKIGIGEDGKAIIEFVPKETTAHKSIRVIAK